MKSMSMNGGIENMKPLTLRLSVSIMIGTLSLIALPSLLFGIKIQVLFLIAWFAAVTVLICRGYPFQRLQSGAASACGRAFPPILFLLCAGAMISAWNLCGTLPALTVFGISFIGGSAFPISAFLCSLVFGFITGTVFGTVGTMGLILLIIGQGLDLPMGLILSSVLSGAFLGYGVSPLADCTNLVASAVEMPLSEVINSQKKLVLPMILTYVAVLGAAGLFLGGNTSESGACVALAAQIKGEFRMGAAVYLPVILVLLMLIWRVPAVLALSAGAFAGLAVAVWYQGVELSAAVSALWSGPDFSGKAAEMQAYFGGGGMKGMTDTVILFLLAFGLFGVFEKCGIVRSMIQPVLERTDSRRKATCLTVLLGFFLNVISASAMCSFIFTISCLAPVYREKGWSRRDLCTASFAGCLYMSLLIPWHSNVATPSALLGVQGYGQGWIQMIPAMAALLVFFLQGCSLDRKIAAFFQWTEKKQVHL